MNGTINCLAATIRRLHAERDAYHREMMREEREKFTALAECDELRALLRECRAELNHAAVFVRTRERMASVGVELYDALLVRIAEALEEKP